MHTHAMKKPRPAAQALLACLGEESRFRLVQALIGGARCVTDLAAEVGLSQSCTTRHLQSLERRKLVSGKRDGKRVLYRIREDDPGLLPLLGWALSHPKGAAGIQAQGPGEKRLGSPGGRRPVTPIRRPAAPTTKPLPPPAMAEADRSPRPPLERSSPAPESEPAPPDAPRPARRGGSDIEDYLL
jgi:ArsR family transcriptional regulator, arsenate/arsenite/antimonite-responsive transcriptional repressor